MPVSDVIGVFGNDDPPKAERNRYAAPIQTAGRNLATGTLRTLFPATAAAFNVYNSFQPRQEALAGQQEGVLNTLLQRSLSDDPQQNLANTLRTLFAPIDPNILSRLSAGDVAQDRVDRMAAGWNPGAVTSTAGRLRDAAVRSGRYYDLARNVYGVVPQVFNSAFAQRAANDAAAAGYVPQIAAGYEAVSRRPTQGIRDRIATVREGQGIESQGIQNALAATQGYHQKANWADKLSKVLKADEATVMQIAQMALSMYTGGMGGGGGGGGMGSLMSMFGGGGGGQPSGTPAYGSTYPGFGGGLYQSAQTPGGGGMSIPVQYN